MAYAPLDNGEQKLTIFDIRTGAEKRSFISDTPMAGPVSILRWSKDDKYFARIGHNTLSVYETPVSIKKAYKIFILVLNFMYYNCCIVFWFTG